MLQMILSEIRGIFSLYVLSCRAPPIKSSLPPHRGPGESKFKVKISTAVSRLRRTRGLQSCCEPVVTFLVLRCLLYCRNRFFTPQYGAELPFCFIWTRHQVFIYTHTHTHAKKYRSKQSKPRGPL